MTDIEDVYPPKDETDGLFATTAPRFRYPYIKSSTANDFFYRTHPLSLFLFIIVDPPSSFRGSLFFLVEARPPA